MSDYSHFFACLHDEQAPVGHIGRGTHYSVLRAAEWRDVVRNPLEKAQVHDFAVIWDEDHDTRVIDVIEQMYIGGLLSPVQFIGERKGGLTVIVASRFRFAHPEPVWENYVASIRAITNEVNGDYWSLSMGMFDKSTINGMPHQTVVESIIQDTDERQITYLRNIDNLWNLGTKNYKKKVTPEPGFGMFEPPPQVPPVPPFSTTRLDFGKQ